MVKPIVVVGSINIDLVARSERIPAPGETISGSVFNTYFGGKGANQAVAAAKLGHPVIMIGKVGNDIFGSQLEQALEAAGVSIQCVQRTRGASGVALIITDRTGENSIVVVPGANGELGPADLEKYRDILLNAGMILTQLEVPFCVVEQVAGFASSHNIPLLLDPAPARELPTQLMQDATWLTPNEVEIRHLLNGARANANEALAAEQLAAKGVRNIVVKLGSRGVLLKQENQTAIPVPGFPVKAVDTTGAGDAFNGAFAVGLLSGKSPLQSAKFANAVAAISVTRRGAQPSMPTRNEVETFLSK
jgi:ribokinase